MPGDDIPVDSEGAQIVSETRLIKITDVQPPTEARLAEVQLATEDEASELAELYNALDGPAKTAYLIYLLWFNRPLGLKMIEMIADEYI